MEERVGNLLVRRAAEVDLEIVRSDGQIAGGSFRSPLVTALTGLLAFGLLTFAVIVRSAPAIGSISVAVMALGWLVFFGGRRTVERTRVALAQGRLSVEGTEEPLDVPADEIEGLGIGQNLPTSTVFAYVKDRGRVLLLDGLSPEEAESAAARLSSALGRPVG